MKSPESEQVTLLGTFECLNCDQVFEYSGGPLVCPKCNTDDPDFLIAVNSPQDLFVAEPTEDDL